MSTLPVWLAVASIALPPQDPPAGERHVSRTGAFALVLPEGWRQLTPDEALTLKRQRAEVPPDLLQPRQSAFYPYGAIDRWLAGDFDGRCLTVQQVDGEYPVDDDGVAVIRRATATPTDDGWQREVLSADFVEVGVDQHAAIECTVRQVHDAARAPIRALVLFVPTGGDTLVLSFRAAEGDFAAALPVFRAAIASMTFARPARGPSEISDRLFYPVLVGALVGLLLVGLRRRPRGTREAEASR